MFENEIYILIVPTRVKSLNTSITLYSTALLLKHHWYHQQSLRSSPRVCIIQIGFDRCSILGITCIALFGHLLVSVTTIARVYVKNAWVGPFLHFEQTSLFLQVPFRCPVCRHPKYSTFHFKKYLPFNAIWVIFLQFSRACWPSQKRHGLLRAGFLLLVRFDRSCKAFTGLFSVAD